VYAKGKGQVFVGLYVANRGIEDTSLPTATMRVADALKRELPQAFVLVVSIILPTLHPSCLLKRSFYSSTTRN
jgi:hypothetical protein